MLLAPFIIIFKFINLPYTWQLGSKLSLSSENCRNSKISLKISQAGTTLNTNMLSSVSPAPWVPPGLEQIPVFGQAPDEVVGLLWSYIIKSDRSLNIRTTLTTAWRSCPVRLREKRAASHCLLTPEWTILCSGELSEQLKLSVLL